MFCASYFFAVGKPHCPTDAKRTGEETGRIVPIEVDLSSTERVSRQPRVGELLCIEFRRIIKRLMFGDFEEFFSDVIFARSNG